MPVVSTRISFHATRCEDYEVDEEYSALLLRRLPPGLPTAARDVL